ncbi:hypothetical protein LAZ67_3002893 [Cordylochernes scorpioides]|uniref:Mariner Mos1 transposase n=1 Tax=Cordylochernes scorpioides TaxID=51811 RepID=A0ABY6KCT9_9ARAC|nr:hypothetical protein LAZ67_3002893 [Cordylochernes scorpioides]
MESRSSKKSKSRPRTFLRFLLALLLCGVTKTNVSEDITSDVQSTPQQSQSSRWVTHCNSKIEEADDSSRMIEQSREKVNDDQHTGRPRSFRCEENKLKIKELIKSNRIIIFRDWTICLYGDNECALKDLKDGKTMTGYFTSVMRGRHTAHVVLQFLAKHSTIQIPHPPYSPDLAPNDFFLYPKLIMNLKGRKFDNVDMIQAESKATLRNLSKSDFISCFDNWKKRWNGCIEAGGAYFEKY